MASEVGFKIKGGKVGILLLHRLCGTPVEMRFVANGLARAGYTVSVPRLAGHCGSEAEIRATSWPDWYRSAQEALDELQKECEVVIAGGLSTGAVLALMLAAKTPRKVQATALLAPTLWLDGWMIPWYARLFRLVGYRALAGLFRFPHHAPHGIKDPKIRDFIQKMRSSKRNAEAGHPVTPGELVLEHRRLSNAVQTLVPYIRQPALIVHPLQDDYAGLSNATYLRDRLAGEVELTVLDDSYHIVTVDRQRHLVVEAIDRFAARLAVQAAVTGAKPAAAGEAVPRHLAVA
ncbi:MAG TPA: alpha/beta fold hydrolase [Hyphomicrobium sp.]|nr:alpha/beta fold hydrolase [Hyphomicrobium sp.]